MRQQPLLHDVTDVENFFSSRMCCGFFRLLVWLLSTVFVPFTLPRHDRIYDTFSCFGGCQLSYFRPTRNLFNSFNAINTSIAGKFILDLHKFYFHPGMFSKASTEREKGRPLRSVSRMSWFRQLSHFMLKTLSFF